MNNFITVLHRADSRTLTCLIYSKIINYWCEYDLDRNYGRYGDLAQLLVLDPRDEWWIRGADFPRLQLLSAGMVILVLMLVWEADWTIWREIWIVGLIAAIAYQLKMVLPYTFIWKNRSKGQTRTA